jgi:hypothetical protein
MFFPVKRMAGRIKFGIEAEVCACLEWRPCPIHGPIQFRIHPLFNLLHTSSFIPFHSYIRSQLQANQSLRQKKNYFKFLRPQNRQILSEKMVNAEVLQKVRFCQCFEDEFML